MVPNSEIDAPKVSIGKQDELIMILFKIVCAYAGFIIFLEANQIAFIVLRYMQLFILLKLLYIYMIKYTFISMCQFVIRRV